MADGSFHRDWGEASIETRWPRLMRRETAAAYCDMTVEQFDRQCPVPPKDQGWRGYRWDRAMLDAWVDSLPNKNGTESCALDGAGRGAPQSPEISAADRRRASLQRA